MSSIQLECIVSRLQFLQPLTSWCPSLALPYFLSDREVSGCRITSDIAELDILSQIDNLQRAVG